MKLPDKVFGIETKEAYKKFLARAKEKPKEPKQNIVTPTSIQNPESYMVLPGTAYGNYSYPNLLVSMEKTHHNKNWKQAHEELHKEGAFMLTIRQYLDFIATLKSKSVYNGKGRKLDRRTIDKVLDEILTKRDPWRGEWLDAKFSESGGKLHISYNHRTTGGKLQPQNTEPLEQCLMENCWFDIGSANRQGMPTKKSRSKEVYFYYPVDGTVAWFRAGSDGAGLNCDWDPRSANSVLGVRVARRHA